MQIFFLFIGREPTAWPASDCLQIMVCSCAMSSNWVWLQIIFHSKWNLTFLLLAITLAWKWQIASPLEDVHSRWSNDKTVMRRQDYPWKRNVVPLMVALWVKWWKRELTRVKKKGVVQKSTWVFTPELILCSIICGKRRWLLMRLSIIIVKRSN